MAQIVKLRRSSVIGKKPTNSQLELGELSINTTDGKLFFAKSGSLGPSIEEVITTNTYNTGSLNLTGSLNIIGPITGSQSLSISGGFFLNNSLLSNQENLDVDSATPEVVAQISSTLYNAAFFDFLVKKDSNLRAGTVYAVHDGSNVEFTETSTNDIGDTTNVSLSVDINSGNLRLLATVTTDNWVIKSLVRGL